VILDRVTTREGYHRFQGDWQPSAAQRRVLDGLAAGRTNVELAAELHLSPETVKWHVSQLLARTGCADRQALGVWWRTRGERRPLLLPFVGLVGRSAALLAAVALTLLLLLAGLAAARRVAPSLSPARSLITALLPADPSPSPSPASSPGSAALATDSPTAVVRMAVTDLVIMYYQPLDAGQLFSEAWTGAATALTQAGVSQLPPPPAYPSDLTATADLHTQSFPALEQLAVGRLAPETLTAAALVALTSNRPDLYTRYASSKLPMVNLYPRPEQPVGFGFTVRYRAPHIIAALVPGGPAEQAGLHRGEVLTAINGFPLGRTTLTVALQQLAVAAAVQPSSGFARTPPVFTVADAAGRQRDVSIPFSQAQEPLERHQVVAGDIGVLRLDALTTGDPTRPNGINVTAVAERVAAVLDEFEQRGVQGWVLDLRGSTSGGDMRALFDLLVSDGRLLGLLGRGQTTPTHVEATGQALPFQRPLVVLVSGATLGGSEIFAAALQAVGRAAVVGEQTAGGFTGVRTERLPDGSVLFLTSHEVVVGPNDTRLNGIGLTPQLVVPGPTPQQDAAGQDPQLEAAVRLLHAQQSSP